MVNPSANDSSGACFGSSKLSKVIKYVKMVNANYVPELVAGISDELFTFSLADLRKC